MEMQPLEDAVVLGQSLQHIVDLGLERAERILALDLTLSLPNRYHASEDEAEGMAQGFGTLAPGREAIVALEVALLLQVASATAAAKAGASALMSSAADSSSSIV